MKASKSERVLGRTLGAMFWIGALGVEDFGLFAYVLLTTSIAGLLGMTARSWVRQRREKRERRERDRREQEHYLQQLRKEGRLR